MKAEKACEEIQRLLREGKKSLSQVIKERPELVVGLDLFYKKLREKTLSATVSAKMKR